MPPSLVLSALLAVLALLLAGCAGPSASSQPVADARAAADGAPDGAAQLDGAQFDAAAADARPADSAVAVDGAAQADAAPAVDPALLANVTAVSAAGEPGAYRFSVTLQSPDTGCDRYADWWEVVSPDGGLIYRRILVHSHVDEQPFTRSGGPIDVAADAEVIVRAHMAPGGYGGRIMRGSVAGGFAEAVLDAGFAENLSREAPLPDGCAF